MTRTPRPAPRTRKAHGRTRAAAHCNSFQTTTNITNHWCYPKQSALLPARFGSRQRPRRPATRQQRPWQASHPVPRPMAGNSMGEPRGPGHGTRPGRWHPKRHDLRGPWRWRARASMAASSPEARSSAAAASRPAAPHPPTPQPPRVLPLLMRLQPTSDHAATPETITARHCSAKRSSSNASRSAAREAIPSLGKMR
jgi:hypothetical protein